jgi:hypothetical protein
MILSYLQSLFELLNWILIGRCFLYCKYNILELILHVHFFNALIFLCALFSLSGLLYAIPYSCLFYCCKTNGYILNILPLHLYYQFHSSRIHIMSLFHPLHNYFLLCFLDLNLLHHFIHPLFYYIIIKLFWYFNINNLKLLYHCFLNISFMMFINNLQCIYHLQNFFLFIIKAVLIFMLYIHL